MSEFQPSRRSFITGLVSLAVTAPAIVKAASLMPVKLMLPSRTLIYSNRAIRSYMDIETILDSNVLCTVYQVFLAADWRYAARCANVEFDKIDTSDPLWAIPD